MTPDLIRRAIQTPGTKTAAAAALGLPRKTMMGMLDRGTLRDVTAPYYQHDEDYLGPQGNAETWRGCWVLNEVFRGEFDEMPISMDYLRRKYSGEIDA